MNKILRTILIIFSIFITILMVTTFFLDLIIMNSTDPNPYPERKLFTAKEGFELLMENDEFKPYEKMLTQVEVGVGREEGKAISWIYYFKEIINGTEHYFSVTICEAGYYTLTDLSEEAKESYGLKERFQYFDTYITNWIFDSVEIFEITRTSEYIIDFYEQNESDDISLHIKINSLNETQNGGCKFEMTYSAGISTQKIYGIKLFYNGETGEFIEVQYLSMEYFIGH